MHTEPTALPTAMLRPADVAKLCGVTRQSVYLWAKDGRLPPPVKLHTRLWMWDPETIRVWLESKAKA